MENFFSKLVGTIFRAKVKGKAKSKQPENLSVEEQALWDAFKTYDKNNDDQIQKEELRDVLEKYMGRAPTNVQLGKIFAKVDLNQNGLIDFQEFKKMMLERGGKKNEYKDIFLSYDKNHDGLITAEELYEVLNQVEKTNKEEVDEIIKMADKDKDGKINFAEFVDFFV